MIVLKGTDLKTKYVVVKHKYGKRFFLTKPRYKDKMDSTMYHRAKIYDSIEQAQLDIATRRGGRKGHKYKIETADTYFTYNDWNIEPKLENGQFKIVLNNYIQPINNVNIKKSQKDLITTAKLEALKSLDNDINHAKQQVESYKLNMERWATQLEQKIAMKSLTNSVDVDSLVDQYKPTSSDFGAMLFTDREE
jgi:hypothetical protein